MSPWCWPYPGAPLSHLQGDPVELSHEFLLLWGQQVGYRPRKVIFSSFCSGAVLTPSVGVCRSYLCTEVSPALIQILD